MSQIAPNVLWNAGKTCGTLAKLMERWHPVHPSPVPKRSRQNPFSVNLVWGTSTGMTTARDSKQGLMHKLVCGIINHCCGIIASESLLDPRSNPNASHGCHNNNNNIYYAFALEHLWNYNMLWSFPKMHIAIQHDVKHLSWNAKRPNDQTALVNSMYIGQST